MRDHAVKMYWGDVQSAQFSRQLAEHCLSFSSRCNKVPGVFIGGSSPFVSVFIEAVADEVGQTSCRMR